MTALTSSQATQIIKDAIGYSMYDAENMKKSIGQIGTYHKWSKEEVRVKFVEFCLKGAEEYQANPMHICSMPTVNDASLVALYVDKAATDFIIAAYKSGE